MEIFKSHTKVYDILEKGKIFFFLSIVAFFVAIVLVFTKGLAFGIDFAGGTVVQVKYDTTPPVDIIRQKLVQDPLFEKASVTPFGNEGEVVIKTPTLEQKVDRDMTDIVKEVLNGTGNFEIRKVDMVGPKVGDELRTKGLSAFMLALGVILLSITFRYEFRFAFAGVVALLHDIVITIGAISLFDIDVNIETIAAILTILGYSIHDTIIVFDRVREYINESKETDFKKIINEAVSRTLSRTLLTSLTVFFVVLTLYLFGGEIMHSFSFPMLVGVTVGTYSSVFVAAQLVIWTGFDVNKYRAKQTEKLKREKEKEKMRSMYEQGTL
ncbi:MAG: preprotein translocase subunit SecF [Campylobacterota bacterium]|nr:preprotein translocase subunit SecF [Campylobacterota bacterium]